MRLTEEEYNALIKGSSGSRVKKPKYRNRKAEYYDPGLKETITFDSEKERDYYLLLKARERRGEIKDLRRQVEIEIQRAFVDNANNKHRAIKYIADFTYYDLKDYSIHYIDVKGFKTEVYKLKKKLLAYRNIIIEEV